MIHLTRALTLAIVAGLGATAAAKSPPVKPAPCGDYGTSVQFEDSPADAAKAARKAEKLVLVLHVSGHFEDPRFT